MSDEWYTPSYIIEPIRELLGGIDLDPCSTAEANKTVKAERFFTKDEDGLNHPWAARTVFCNPPYSKPLCAKFVDKLIRDSIDEIFLSAALLVHSKTDLNWYHQAASACDWMVFPRGRIKFVKGEEPAHGNTLPLFDDIATEDENAIDRPTSGSTIFLFGDTLEPWRVYDCFGIGATLVRKHRG